MRGRQWNVFAMATVTAVALAACGGDQGADEAPEDAPAQTETQTQTPSQTETQTAADLPEGVTQEQYQEGQQLFTGAGACMACHGPQATGTALAPNLTDSEWINISGRNYDEIVEVIQTGVAQPQEHPGPMPPLGGANLNDQQVESLAAYVYGVSQD